VTLTLTDSTISGNSAFAGGGGIYALGTATLTNSTISGNMSRTIGGGIRAFLATLTNCTVTENSAHMGGGIFHDENSGPPETFTIKNTVIAGNFVDFAGAGPDAFGNFRSQGSNLVGIIDGSSGFITDLVFNIPRDLTGTIANPLDPKLGPLKSNGGKTQTHALRAGSPAIDAGNSAGMQATDQRGTGFRRVKDGNGDRRAAVDIGAFER
jgi:predicted outer membrane repeat protein